MHHNQVRLQGELIDAGSVDQTASLPKSVFGEAERSVSVAKIYTPMVHSRRGEHQKTVAIW